MSNKDTFRMQYRQLTPEEQNILQRIKLQAGAMEQLVNELPPSRERSLAMTKLEESVMWATKAITAEPPPPPAPQ